VSEPSIAAIARLTELAQKYKDKKLSVVGVTKEDFGVVREFVDGQAEKIGYDIAVDPDQSVYDAYMTAFNQEDVPYVFIVDAAGKIAWHGSTTAPDMEEELENLLPESSESPDAGEVTAPPTEPNAPGEEVEG
jgi:peroxiredoxin